MNTNWLIWAVVALTGFVAACITALTIWHPADNTAVITAILGAATPTISVLILLLQGSKTAQKVEEVQQEARVNAEVRGNTLEEVKNKVDEVKVVAETVHKIVNGQRDELKRRITELEERARRGEGKSS